MNFFSGKKATELSTSVNDPMNAEVFPDEIRELVLSYLPVTDLVCATLVSKLWNFTIGSSLTFRKRIAINIHSWNKHPPIEIGNSNRSYETLSISDFKISSQTLRSLRDKNWRNVTLSIGKISSQRSFVKLMESFSTVKNLKIMCNNIRELSGSPRLALPDLESLVLTDITLDLFDMFITYHPSLKSLSLRFVSCDILSPRRVGVAIEEFFKLNSQLKDLEINYYVTNDLFVDDISKSNLKLRSLTIGLDETTKTTQGNIEKFLRSQGDSIEHLKLVLHQRSIKRGPHEWGYWDNGNEPSAKSSNDMLMIFHVWNSMTSLKSLNIRFLQNSGELGDIRGLLKPLKRNTNVTSLSIQAINVNVPFSFVIDFLKLMPNLKTIFTTKLDPAIVRYAAINLKALRDLSCFSFDGECQQEFNELKASRNDVNKFIVITDLCALG